MIDVGHTLADTVWCFVTWQQHAIDITFYRFKGKSCSLFAHRARLLIFLLCLSFGAWQGVYIDLKTKTMSWKTLKCSTEPRIDEEPGDQTLFWHQPTLTILSHLIVDIRIWISVDFSGHWTHYGNKDTAFYFCFFILHSNFDSRLNISVKYPMHHHGDRGLETWAKRCDHHSKLQPRC